jgi:hypothetical protein
MDATTIDEKASRAVSSLTWIDRTQFFRVPQVKETAVFAP